jgi:hypothetical protein
MMKALESLVICSLRPASVPRTPVSCSPVDLKGADIRRKITGVMSGRIGLRSLTVQNVQWPVNRNCSNSGFRPLLDAMIVR